MLGSSRVSELRSGSFYSSKLNYLGSLAYPLQGCKISVAGEYVLDETQSATLLASSIFDDMIPRFVRRGKFNWNEERVECKCSNTRDTHTRSQRFTVRRYNRYLTLVYPRPMFRHSFNVLVKLIHAISKSESFHRTNKSRNPNPPLFWNK